MHHAFADKYSDLSSPVHRLDPRVKLGGCVAMLLSVALTPPGRTGLFAGWAVMALAAIVLSRVPAGYVLKRSLLVMPFVLVVAVGVPFLRAGETIWSFRVGALAIAVTDNGLAMLGAVVVKSYLATTTLVLLSATTRFASLVEGLRKLGAPKLLILILSFMYRYLFVLVEEVELIERARRSRSPAGGGFRQARILAGVVGILFVRTFERAERVYQAMLARGFRGEPPYSGSLRFRASDAAAGAAVIAAVGAVWGIG